MINVLEEDDNMCCLARMLWYTNACIHRGMANYYTGYANFTEKRCSHMGALFKVQRIYVDQARAQ